eukprot:NODE_9598_length_1412_cov_6.828794.p2 GENE.NODE_9598_length_1412_cov_6.828794~~NODE_9598_length_1412_cov_6.828794.p2  ORF type:complete len:218 (-),score=52.23 NODE_9598_length_1412_cov_6.828794:80-733(-)
MKFFVKMRCKFSDFVASFPFCTTQDGQITGGAMPFFIDVLRWPTWYPFCNSATLVGIISDSQVIYHVVFKISFVTIDCVMLMALVDKLREDGTFSIVLTTARGDGGQEWLGYTIPPQQTMFRAHVTAARFKNMPDSYDGGDMEFYIEGPEDIGIEWIAKLYWKTVCTKVIPLIAAQLPHFAGSEIDNDFQDAGVLAPLRPSMLRAEANMRSTLESRR